MDLLPYTKRTGSLATMIFHEFSRGILLFSLGWFAWAKTARLGLIWQVSLWYILVCRRISRQNISKQKKG
jgi:hypothetical protein